MEKWRERKGKRDEYLKEWVIYDHGYTLNY